MLPTVFLSLSGVDAKFVESVHNNLPDGLAYYYPKSFANGENLVAAMEDRVGKSQVFVLFASRESVKSVWVNFEIERARLSKIKDKNFKCLVFPIGPDVDFNSLPSWMGEFWVGSAGQTPRDIARYIRGVLATLAEQSGTVLPALGRGGLVDNVRREFQNTAFLNKIAPNIFVISGQSGIGRRTVEKLVLPALFPSNSEINFGPEFDLPPHSDLSDIYRAIRQEVEPSFSLKEFETSLGTFNALPLADQATEVWKSMEHFASLGQAVTIVVGYGLYEDRGDLKSWASAFLATGSHFPNLKVCLVSGRQLRYKDLHLHPHVQQVQVSELEDRDTKTLILETVPIFGGDPQLPNDRVIQSIGGHPTVARSVARLLALRGPAVVNGDIKQLYDIQEAVLAESLGFDNLSHPERDILSILSWVPKLNATMLSELITKHHNIKTEKFSNIIEYLMAGCLLQISGANYLISSPIRGMFRRKHGYGSTELRSVFAERLREAWAQAVADDEMKSELFDAFVYMTALEGGTLPKEFNGLLLASTLQDLVRDAYDRRHNDDSALERVVSWGVPAMEMRMDENTREEILSYVVRAQVRLHRIGDANHTIEFMKKRGYRSTAYLEAFAIRIGGGDLTRALSLLRTAREIRKYMNSVVADLAICLKLLGRWADLAALINEEKARVERNPVLLDIKIGMLVAGGEFDVAEREIARLRAMPFDDGRADSREATILMNRDHAFDRAYDLLTEVLNRKTRGANGVRQLRAIAAARGRKFDDARRDADYIRGRPGGEDSFHRIDAEIKLSQRDYDGAQAARKRIKSESAQDRLLKARIVEAQGLDVSTPIHLREQLLNEASSIRATNRAVDEYDFE